MMEQSVFLQDKTVFKAIAQQTPLTTKTAKFFLERLEDRLTGLQAANHSRLEANIDLNNLWIVFKWVEDDYAYWQFFTQILITQENNGDIANIALKVRYTDKYYNNGAQAPIDIRLFDENILPFMQELKQAAQSTIDQDNLNLRITVLSADT